MQHFRLYQFKCHNQWPKGAVHIQHVKFNTCIHNRSTAMSSRALRKKKSYNYVCHDESWHLQVAFGGSSIVIQNKHPGSPLPALLAYSFGQIIIASFHKISSVTVSFNSKGIRSVHLHVVHQGFRNSLAWNGHSGRSGWGRKSTLHSKLDIPHVR